MNGDLISREALLKEYEWLMTQTSECNKPILQEHIDRINWQPVVDAEPVRHGKWIYNPNANDWGIGGYVCSECHTKNDNLPCGKVANPMIFVGTKYCPNCGVKMDLGLDNGKNYKSI